jgi:hypothetical protein
MGGDIHAAPGLAVQVVDGSAPTNMYRVSREEPHKILNSKIAYPDTTQSSTGEKEFSLSSDQIIELTRIALRLENHFGAPQDIEEFRIDGGAQNPHSLWIRHCHYKMWHLAVAEENVADMFALEHDIFKPLFVLIDFADKFFPIRPDIGYMPSFLIKYVHIDNDPGGGYCLKYSTQLVLILKDHRRNRAASIVTTAPFDHQEKEQ